MGIGKSPKIQLKTPAQIEAMRVAGLVVATTLATLAQHVKSGVTTGDLDAIARQCIADAGATPSFLGYHGFPAVICTSVNDEVVHGIPGSRTLVDGDLIKIDCGAIVDGWHGDAAISVPVGQVSAQVATLSQVTEASMWAGLAMARPGGRLTDISHAVEQATVAAGTYGIVADYGGHGIGTAMHMDPHILNYGAPGRGPKLEVGMALAIEPMATLGQADVVVGTDGWTVSTADGSVAAHWEHTVAITEHGPWVLTALDDVRL